MVLVLASQSMARAAILQQADIPFQAVNAQVNEAEIKQRLCHDSLEDIVMALAESKALRVAQQYREDHVLGCDQILVFAEQLWDKPKDITEVRQHLQRLRGKKHQLFSAMVVVKYGIPHWKNLQKADLTMRNFSDNFLDQYVERLGDDLCSSVGAYKIEGLGAQLFADIQGDSTTIMGLPLFPLMGYLRDEGLLRT